MEKSICLEASEVISGEKVRGVVLWEESGEFRSDAERLVEEEEK
jgi:hypothetical protein